MNRDHAVIEELLAVRSLGGLDGEDIERLERELASHGDCAECRRLQTELDETAGRLAFALAPMPVSATADEIVRSGARRRRGVARSLAVAAAVVVVVAAAVALFGPARTTEVRATAAQVIVRFAGTGGELAMAYEPGRPGALLVGSGLGDPGPGRVYEIWAIRGGTPTSGGCVRPLGGTVATFVAADVSDADLMAVTVEPSSCPSLPTSEPVLTATLS